MEQDQHSHVGVRAGDGEEKGEERRGETGRRWRREEEGRVLLEKHKGIKLMYEDFP